MVALAGAVVMADRIGGASVTLASVDPVTLPRVAETRTEPVPAIVARPVQLMVSADWFDEPHVTWLVRFCVEVSE
jgi:hypothetical protein